MHFVRCFLVFVAFLGSGTTAALAQAEPGRTEPMVGWLSAEWRQIGAEQRELLEVLRGLPPEPARSLTERLGYHSGYSSSRDTVEWVEMDLQTEETIDAVVLIAAAGSDGGLASTGYGFPLRFRVETRGEEDSAERFMLADFTGADFPNPGNLPVYLPANQRKARYIRITATRLFQEDRRPFFALGEIMILQGNLNVASGVGRGNFTCSRTRGAVPVWGLANLVDGHTVLGPPVGQQPSPTLGYHSRLVNPTLEPDIRPRWVQVDLGREFPIQQVRLFPAHPPEFAHRQGFGFPFLAKMELANTADFNGAVEIPGFSHEGTVKRPPKPDNPGDNVVTYVVRGQRARYVRFTGLDLHDANGLYNLALAEMQVWSEGRNVALNQPVTAFDSFEKNGWSAEALVDGFNSRANIVEWPEWLSGLSRRREISHRLAQLDARRAAILAQLTATGWWLLIGVVTAVLMTLSISRWRQRRKHQLEIEALRHRISRDLHDEIGSSLGSIVFISQDMIAAAKDDPQMRHELAEIQSIARQTVDSMHDITRVMQSEAYGHDDLVAHLREIATRMLRTIPHSLRFDAGDLPRHLPVDRHRDLVLMFKEALHNILQHAQATRVDITVAHATGVLSLTVRDNGRGFDLATLTGTGMGLANLRRRAAKLDGEIRLTSAPNQGTTLAITIPSP